MEAAPIIPYRNILVIQTGFVGDMVLTTPLLRELRRAAPEAAIALLHAPRTAGIVRRSPHIDDRIVFDKRGSERGARASARLARDLRRRRFDLVISAHRSLRSGWLALATGAGRRIGFDHPPSAVFYTDTVPYSRWESTFVRRKLRLLEPLGIEAKDERTEAYFNEEDAAAAEDLLRASSVHPPFAVLALGSAWPTKRWPGVRFGELAAILARRGMQSVLVGGAEDAGAADEAARAGPAVDWTGRTSLEVLAALLSRAALFVGNDSGALHLACAAGTPAVALFGPTGPEQFRFDGKVLVVRSDAPCAPCSDHGSRECPLGNWICLPGIDADRIAREAERLLEGAEPRRGPGGSPGA
ncbi:MAG: glycosyltransferase family 9 protein [Candidatus Eisenbacteria bacterium]|nr:glycosyltransferase family 9 protein [Candidatus Eisenbacteria bacterium]